MASTANPLNTPATVPLSIFRSLCLLFCLIPFISACIGPGKPSTLIESYVLEYPSPRPSNLQPVIHSVKVAHFSVAKPFNSTSMVFRPEPYKMDMYASHRWMVNPGDMVSDFLYRDMRNSGLFRAVFSFHDFEDSRFVLEGNIEEFMEMDEGEKSHTALTVTATLLDHSRPSTPDRVVFQKKYHSSEPLQERSADGFARAMSLGMEKISSQMILDVHDALNSLQKK